MNDEMTLRTNTKQVWCGDVAIGGGAPVSIQSMTNTKTEDAEATAAQILALSEAGADIVRVAVPTIEAAKSFAEIKKIVSGSDNAVPIVADIHFDYKIALETIQAGADKIRLNPGNIGGAERIKAVADAAGAKGIPIRIGVNGGSLEEYLQGLYKENPAKALAESALNNIELLRNTGFEDIVVSIKSSDVVVNTEAHKILSKQTTYPLHIGITEAGFGEAGIIKSAAGIGAILAMGIGDTMRVSLTGNPVREIPAAREILKAVNLLPGQITMISCPTCGRCKVDLPSLSREISAVISEIEKKRVFEAKLVRKETDLGKTEETLKKLKAIERPITVAIMGCAVNGPGEASHADLGVACGVDGGIYFEKGVKIGSVKYDEIAQKIIDGISLLYQTEHF